MTTTVCGAIVLKHGHDHRTSASEDYACEEKKKVRKEDARLHQARYRIECTHDGKHLERDGTLRPGDGGTPHDGGNYIGELGEKKRGSTHQTTLTSNTQGSEEKVDIAWTETKEE
jgi:hypothetical protein